MGEITINDDGTIEGAVLFENPDSGEGIVRAGAFGDTLVPGKPLIWKSGILLPIGEVAEIHDDEAGVYFKANLLDTDKARWVLAIIRNDGAEATIMFTIPNLREFFEERKCDLVFEGIALFTKTEET